MPKWNSVLFILATVIFASMAWIDSRMTETIRDLQMRVVVLEKVWTNAEMASKPNDFDRVVDALKDKKWDAQEVLAERPNAQKQAHTQISLLETDRERITAMCLTCHINDTTSNRLKEWLGVSRVLKAQAEIAQKLLDFSTEQLRHERRLIQRITPYGTLYGSLLSTSDPKRPDGEAISVEGEWIGIGPSKLVPNVKDSCKP